MPRYFGFRIDINSQQYVVNRVYHDVSIIINQIVVLSGLPNCLLSLSLSTITWTIGDKNEITQKGWKLWKREGE